MKEDIYFDSNEYKLAGTLYKAEHEEAIVILVQGGAKIPRKNGPYTKWHEHLLNRNISSFIFDFRGLGESEGEFDQTSLEARYVDTKNAIDFLKKYSEKKPYLLGVSMGGPVAIHEANEDISGLILLAPAAYSLEAREKNFGPDFTEAIRKPESWKHSPDFEALSKYPGKTFLFYGTEDEVIPREVLETYKGIVEEKGEKVFVLDGVTHKSWKDDERSEVLNAVTQFIMSSNER